MKYKAFQFQLSTAALVTVAGFLMLCALTAFAQSGRRAKKSTPLPPVPTPEASPTPTPGKSPERGAIPVLLGANTLDSFGDIPLYFGDSVAKSCAQVLQQRSIIRVDVSSRSMTRSDASKRAKELKEGYVVVLELRSDRSRTGNREEVLAQVYLQYVVYAGGTAKSINSGIVYQQGGGLRDIIGGGASTGAAEQRLKNAARVAGERILSAVLGPKP